MDSRRPLRIGYPIRLLSYAAMTGIIMHLCLLMVSRESMQILASEDGPIEIAQIILLVISGTLASISAIFAVQNRTVIFILAAGIFCAASREADDWFARLIFDDSYKWFVCLPLLSAAAYRAWQNRETVYQEVFNFLSQPYASTIAFSVIMVATLCNTFDRSSFWPAMAMHPNLGDQKAVIEETAELFSYLILLFGMNELLIHSWLGRSSESRRAVVKERVSNALHHSTQSPMNGVKENQLRPHGEHPPQAPKPKQKPNDPISIPSCGTITQQTDFTTTPSMQNNSTP